jgi:site-specific recombinase XerD
MNEILLSELRYSVDAVLRAKQYREACIKRYNHTWDHVQAFMNANGIIIYDRSVGDKFLSEWHSNKPYEQLTHREQERVRHVDVLSGYLADGHIIQHYHYRRPPILFEGELGMPFNAFIEYERTIKKESSIARYKERIEHLYKHLQRESITVKYLDTSCILRFLNQLNRDRSNVNRNNILMTIRVFIRYLCSRELLTNNNTGQWMSILKLRKVHLPKIPSVYSKEEVETLIGAVDRGNPQGKRDYAMILLAARYGLRISDIIGMRYCNLDWEHNQIILFQQKTGKKIVLPLSEEVGNAIIDYLKYGRPKVEAPYIFITAHAPYKELTSNGMGATIKEYFRIAGIDFTKRRHGPHALRHSLASNLLQSNESLPIISEILGHSNTETTTEYLRIDINQLRQCALDVPFVPSSFYDNLYEH